MADWSALDALGQRMMTHQAEQPNTALPYIEATRRFARGGIAGLIGYRDPLGDLLQSDAANTALGVMTPGTLGKLGSASDKVRAAAIRTPQGTFEGPNHASIIDMLARKYGDSVYKNIEDGFVTTS